MAEDGKASGGGRDGGTPPARSSDHARALEAAAAERIDEAMAICREALAASPDETWPLEMLGYLLHRKDDVAGAIEALEAVCTRPRPKAALLHALGRLYYRAGSFARAIRAFDKAIEIAPDRGETHYLRGLAQFHAGRTRDAIESFERSVEMDPANVIACYHLAMAHARAGNLRKSIRCLKQVVSLGSETAAAHYQLGVAHYALGEMGEAARHFARSIEIDPDDERSRRMFEMVGRRLDTTRPQERVPALGRILKPLRANLVAKVALVTVAVFVAAGGGLTVWLVRSAEADDMEVAQARAEAIADTVRHALRLQADSPGDRPVREMVASLGLEPGIESIRVMSKAGRVLASTDAAEVGSSVSSSNPGCRSCHAAGGRPSTGWGEFRVVPLPSGARGLTLLRPLFAGPGGDAGRVGTAPLGMLEMTTSLAKMDEHRHGRRHLAIVVGVATCVVLGAIVVAIVWLMIRRPLAGLEAAVGRVASGELDTEVPGERPDEVGRLMAAFNRMTRELRRNRHEIENANREMEKRVEDATAKLRESYASLESANRMLLDFDRRKAAYVQKAVHDLRSPLSAVLLTLRNVRAGLLGELAGPQTEAIGRAEQRAEAMARLISDLLDLEQLRAGPARPIREPVRVGAVFERSVEALRPRIDLKRMSVEASGLADLPPVEADSAGIESVASNLVDNAVKYTPAGGLVRVTGRTEDGSVVVEVSDTGIGIPLDELPLLFSEFFRASNARVCEKEGTGLGLTIVRRIVEDHGGSVSVRSDVGVGTTFTVRLPAAG